MSRHQIIDDDDVMLSSGSRHPFILFIRPKHRVHGQLDSVEESVNCRCVSASPDSTSPLHGASVYTLDPNFMKSRQQFIAPQSLQHSLVLVGNYGFGIAGKPDGSSMDKVLRSRTPISMPPLYVLAGDIVA